MRAFVSHLTSAKAFPRWQRGSCIEAQPQQVAGQDTPFVFSFFSDASAHLTVVECVAAVQETARGVVVALVRAANTWKKYRPLWKMQRVRAR